MKLVVLAGGYGTRLSEETHLKPKPMVEINNIPILVHILTIYSNSGFNEFVIATGYKNEIINTVQSDFKKSFNVNNCQLDFYSNLPGVQLFNIIMQNIN